MKKALKILAVMLLLTATVIPAQAQRRVVRYLPKYEQEPYHFGFLLAYNQMMYTVKTVENYQNAAQPADSWPSGPYSISNTSCLYVYNIETLQTPGFTVGIIGSKRLGRYFDLRFIPSLSFSERRMRYDIAVVSRDNTVDMKAITKSIGTTFVEFPINIKYRSKRYNNIGAYLMGGVNPKLDLASQKDNKEIDGQGNEFINNLVTKRFDCAAELGAGFDIYNQWFKMGIEVKMSYGLLDIVKNQAFIYTAPIDKLRNKMFQISLLFE
ncbi:MAG: PorT family protein [Bacteroidales bacterium]|nr:PorT family protein [Bacteroidales bacterium]MBR6227052.1 PorT family protein [Bacteroidales bacterium]